MKVKPYSNHQIAEIAKAERSVWVRIANILVADLVISVGAPVWLGFILHLNGILSKGEISESIESIRYGLFDNSGNYLTFLSIVAAGGFALYAQVGFMFSGRTVGDNAEIKAMYSLSRYYNLVASLMFCAMAGFLVLIAILHEPQEVESYPLLLAISVTVWVACATMGGIKGQTEYNKLLSIERIEKDNEVLDETRARLGTSLSYAESTRRLLLKALPVPIFLAVLVGLRLIMFQYETGHQALNLPSYGIGFVVSLSMAIAVYVFVFSVAGVRLIAVMAVRFLLLLLSVCVNLLCGAFLAQVESGGVSATWRLWNWVSWFVILNIPLIAIFVNQASRDAFGQIRANQIAGRIRINNKSIERTERSLQEVS